MSITPHERRPDLPEPWRIAVLCAALGLIILTLPYVGRYRASLADDEIGLPVLLLFVFSAFFFLLFHFLVLGRSFRRWLGLAVFLVLFAAVALLLRGPTQAVGLVEKVHLLEYGLLSILFYWAFRERFDGPEIHLLAVIFTILSGLLDEYVQHLLPIRVGEFRDVWINCLSGVLGQGYVILVFGLHRRVKPRLWNSVRNVFFGLALLVLASGLFLQTVQLGHLIEDDRLALAFKSRFSAADFESENRAHRRNWRAAAFSFTAEEEADRSALWALEDFFITEARRHIGTRNHYLDTGRNRQAAKEERLLAHYYPAYMEVSSQKLPTERRRTIMRELLSSPPFIHHSPEMSHLVTGWTGSRLWTFVACGVLLLLAAAVISHRLRT